MDLLLQAGKTAFIAHAGDGELGTDPRRRNPSVDAGPHPAAQQAQEGVPQGRRNLGKKCDHASLGCFPERFGRCAGVRFECGDRIVVCSDGLYRYMDEDELAVEMPKGGAARRRIG